MLHRLRVAAVVLPLLAACSSNHADQAGSGGGEASSTSAASTSTASASASTSSSSSSGGAHKPMQRGLVDMGTLGLAAGATPSSDPSEIEPYIGSITGIVVNATWEELEPKGPADLVEGDTLDQQMAAVRAFNASHPTAPLSVKIRVSGAFKAPAWAMQLDGGPLMIPANPSSKTARSGPIGKYWMPDYRAAWRALQAKLAAKYDEDPIVYEVAVTSCSFQTDEPFVIPAGDLYLPVLHAAGYDDAHEQACLSSALEDYAAWQHTWVDYTFNDYHTTDAQPKDDQAFLYSVMKSCTTANNCILANHAIADDTPTGHGGPDTYAEFLAQSSVSHVNLQTFAPNPGNWCAIIPIATTYGALSIELWPNFGGFTTLTPAQVGNLATALANGTTPDPAACP